MRVTAIQAKTERKWQDRSVRCAEKHRRRARTKWLGRLIRSAPAARPTAEAVQGGKCLSSPSIQASITSDATPLGECRPQNISAVALRGTSDAGTEANI